MKRIFFVLGSMLMAGCTKQPATTASAPAAPTTISVSHWTERTDLFMAYPPLVAGAKRRFAVHFTSLSTFRPFAAGNVIVRLTREGGEPEVFSVSAPSRPGIFGLDVQPRQAGQHHMTVSISSPGLEDSHDLGSVAVYASEKEIFFNDTATTEKRIAFLKEQQWSLDFATVLAAERGLRESIRVSGEVRPRSGGEVLVTAPISGRITTSSSMPVIGASVVQESEIASLVPVTPTPGDRPSLEYAISEASTAVVLARRDRERTDRLLNAGAIPARRLDEARAVEATAVARLDTAKKRLAQYEASRQADGDGPRFLMRAPISGVVAEVKGSPGANVAQGDELLRIVAIDEVYVVANVPESDAPRLAQLTGAEIETPGPNSTLPAGRLVSKSSFVEPQSRTISVVYDVPNPGRRLAVGQSVFVKLFLSGIVRAVTVPESAIVDDGGRPVLFIQHEGESFSRRPVRLGIREANLVQVVDGLKPDERVVTRGAYLIRLAALSTQIPAHGHVH